MTFQADSDEFWAHAEHFPAQEFLSQQTSHWPNCYERAALLDPTISISARKCCCTFASIRFLLLPPTAERSAGGSSVGGVGDVGGLFVETCSTGGAQDGSGTSCCSDAVAARFRGVRGGRSLGEPRSALLDSRGVARRGYPFLAAPFTMRPRGTATPRQSSATRSPRAAKPLRRNRSACCSTILMRASG